MYMKLQGFLRKKRAIKPNQGNIYTPRTETGNYIINGKVTKLKKGDLKVEIDEEIKNKINHLANVIVQNLITNSSVLMNIQIEEEFSQYDVLFSYKFTNYGTHQRGILANDLIIGVIGFGSFGFRIDIADTDPSYYTEKLGIHSNFLSFLFNDVRKKLKENN